MNKSTQRDNVLLYLFCFVSRDGRGAARRMHARKVKITKWKVRELFLCSGEKCIVCARLLMLLVIVHCCCSSSHCSQKRCLCVCVFWYLARCIFCSKKIHAASARMCGWICDMPAHKESLLLLAHAAVHTPLPWIVLFPFLYLFIHHMHKHTTHSVTNPAAFRSHDATRRDRGTYSCNEWSAGCSPGVWCAMLSSSFHSRCICVSALSALSAVWFLSFFIRSSMINVAGRWMPPTTDRCTVYTDSLVYPRARHSFSTQFYRH